MKADPGRTPTREVRVRVAGLAVRDGRLLAVEHEKAGRRYFLLPGGGLDPGERLGECMERELREELGVTARAGALLMACESIAPDRSRHILHVILAATVDGEPRATGQDGRVVGAAWLSGEDLDRAMFYPDITGWLKRALAGDAGAGAELLAPEWK